MIRNVIFLLLLLSLTARGNEKKVIEKSIEVKRVTVYLKGAQITGSGSAFLSPGESTLKFTGLPSDLDSKSIRVTSSQNLSILAVNSGQDFLTSETKNELILKKEKIIADMRNNRVEMETLNKRLDFLTQNQKIAGSQNGIVLEKLIAANEYFTKEFTGLSEKKKEAELKSERLNQELQNLEKQINESNQKEQKNLGNITVGVDVAAAGNYDFNIEFHTQNAGWFPGYDFRVRSVNEPMEMNYRANVYQNTGIDWKNVQLKLSSANPDHSAHIPEMKTYYLDFGKLPPRYSENTITRVSGRVFSADDNTPLIGASVMVKNNSIGTITDSNGKYELNIPENAESLIFSFIGMEMQERYIDQSVINVSMYPSLMALDEAVVVGYGIKPTLAGSVAEAMPRKASAPVKIRGTSGIQEQIQETVRQTTIEFEIQRPFTIPSDSKNHNVGIQDFQIPAEYKYSAFPVIRPKVLLNGFISGWETLNLIEGEANIFMEGTFTGKNLLELKNFSDTLKISLGADKNVIVKREPEKKFSSSKFIGTKTETTRVWKITVRNNKPESISLDLFDQIPVSLNDEIEVTNVNTDGGTIDKETGKITWNMKLAPNEQIEKRITYTVRYPKNRSLIVD
jgi:hypothetical protein